MAHRVFKTADSLHFTALTLEPAGLAHKFLFISVCSLTFCALKSRRHDSSSHFHCTALWIPSTLYPLATLMLLIAHQYSSPPLLLNHCGWGEFTAAIAMNLATPLFAVFLAAPELVDHGLLLGIQTVLQDGTARLLLVPPFFNKIALLLMLNIADRLPDWAAKKRTLAVVLGDGGAIRVHLGLMMLATLSTLWTLDTSFPIVPFPPARAAPLVTTILVLAGLMPGLGISLDLGQLPDPSYHAAKTGWKGEVVRSVKQAPYPVLAVFATVLGLEILADPGVLAAVGLHLRLLPLYVFAYNILSARPPPPRPANEVKWRPPKDPVVIAGAGPAGLAMCLALRQMGFRVRIFEKRTRRELESGADVGLWPASLEVLRALGVQELDTWPVRRVDMVNGDGGLIRKVDMDAVNPPTSGSFALVSRKELISRLLDEVGEENIEFGREVNGFDPARGSGFSVEVIGPRGGAFWVRSTLLVAADGIGSQMRKLLRDGEGRPRYAGEVCHRGVVRVGRSGTVKEVLKTEEGVMKLVYGKGWRGSYGMIGEGVGYWWYKHTLESGAAESLEQVKPDGKGWPAPFGLLLEATDEDSYYVEPVLDRTETWDWGGEEGRVICAGDAAHPVTPNMAQGG